MKKSLILLMLLAVNVVLRANGDPVAEPRMEYDFPWSYDDTRQKVKELTLCVTAARKGRRYDDLCVSEIIVLGD